MASPARNDAGNQIGSQGDHSSQAGAFLVALPRDPEWIFLFWELPDAAVAAALNPLGATVGDKLTRRMLRLMDVTDIVYDGANAWRIYDTAIDDLADNWYLKVPEAGRDYLVELGFHHLDGRFAPAARSNLVRVPTDRLSDETDEEWATIDSERILSASAAAPRSDYRSSGMPLQGPYLGSGANLR